MRTDYGRKCLGYGEFRELLNGFSDFTADGLFKKMDYNMWRAMIKNRPFHSWVDIYWDEKGIEITFENDDTCHFFDWKSGFANFLWEYWMDEEMFEEVFGEHITRAKEAALKAGETLKKLNVNIQLNTENIDKQINELKNKICEEKKDMKGFNFDFGPMNGSVVRMSMYGLAVKNKVGTYVSYDAKTGEIMDVDIFNFDGASFLYKMPVAIKDIAVGDIVIHQNVPMFVVGKATDEKGLVVIDPVCGERKEIMLPRSPFGFNFATKVVNFLGDMFGGTASKDNPFGNMWMFMAMQGDNDMSAIMPMMMMSQGNIDPTMAMVMMAMGQNGGKMDMGAMMPMMWAMQNAKVAPAATHTCNCGGNCGHHEG